MYTGRLGTAAARSAIALGQPRVREPPPPRGVALAAWLCCADRVSTSDMSASAKEALLDHFRRLDEKEQHEHIVSLLHLVEVGLWSCITG